MKSKKLLSGVLAALLAASALAVNTAAADGEAAGITGNGRAVPDAIRLNSVSEGDYPIGDVFEPILPELTDEDIEFASSLLEEEEEQSAEPIKLNASVQDYFDHDYTDGYLYNTLNANEKKLYAYLYDICENVLYSSKTFTTSGGYGGHNYSLVSRDSMASYGLSETSIEKVCSAFDDDNPQFFFFDGASYSSGYLWTYIYSNFNTPESRSSVINAVINKMDDHYDYLTGDDDEVFKEQYIAMLICDNCEYDYEAYNQGKAGDYSGNWRHQTIAGYFLYDTAVCNGYADTFKFMCNIAGIDCVYDAMSGVHAWNRVNLAGNWYIADTTWMDQTKYNYIDYRYFNNSYNSIQGYDTSGAHKSNHFVVTLPACTLDSHYVSGTYWGTGTSIIHSYCTYSEQFGGFSFVENAPVYMNNIPGEGYRLEYVKIYENDVLKATLTDQRICYIMGDNDMHFEANFVVVDRAKVEAFVDRLYTIILDRNAEAGGLSEWTNALISGRSTSADIVYGLANSTEFKNKNLSDSEAIERMYRAMLGRSSDPSGKADWLKAMSDGVTINGIINGFSGSQEFANVCAEYGINAGSITTCEARDINVNLTSFVSRMYTKAIGRNYDINGLNDWTGDYIVGYISADDIAYGFIFSQEFINRNLSNEAYVDTLYRTFFDREPDAGKYGWISELNSGASRESVLDGFLGAQEFINLKASFGV